MFEQSILTPGPAGNRFWSAGAGLAGEAALIAMAAMAPLVLPQAGPKLTHLTHIVFPPPPSTPAPPRPAQLPVTRTTAIRQLRAGVLIAPVHTPPSAHILVDDPADFAAPTGVPGGVTGGMEGGVPGVIMDSILTSAHAAPPPPVAPAVAKPVPVTPPVRVREGGLVHPAVLVNRVEPAFPLLASRMRISGTVQMEGVIGTNGRIGELRVISGHPLLVNAAVDAVRQWLYRPTLLNGDPVEVITTISVHFRLR